MHMEDHYQWFPTEWRGDSSRVHPMSSIIQCFITMMLVTMLVTWVTNFSKETARKQIA